MYKNHYPKLLSICHLFTFKTHLNHRCHK